MNNPINRSKVRTKKRNLINKKGISLFVIVTSLKGYDIKTIIDKSDNSIIDYPVLFFNRLIICSTIILIFE